MKNRLLSALTFVSLLFAIVYNNAVAQTQPFPANKTYSYGVMPTNKNSQDAMNNYNTWKTNFVEACSNGRFRVKFDDRSQTVSEGIGYGMLLSAYAGDRTLFDGLWNYYKDNRNGNGVMNWKINGCSGAIGYNGATDSEVDAAMALIVADYQWGTSGAINYKNDAKALISAIKNFEVESGSYVLKPGDQFGGSNLTNASYFAPGYFRTFATYMNDSFWNNVADKAYIVINNNLTVNNAAGGLVSDWSTASGSYSSAAGGYANGGRNYSYDAARTPWRIAVDYVWYGNASAKTYSKKSSDFVRVNLGGSQNVKDGYSQNGSAISGYHNSTFVGAFAAAAMGGENQSHLDNSYSDLKGINDAGSYFNQTLKTLYLFLLTGNFYLPGSGPVVPPVEVVQAPYGSAPVAIPGKIEAEKYDLGGTLAYNDATIGNEGGAFRSEDVDIEATTDAGGGYNIGYTAAGEWLEYTVNVTAAGKYDFAVRVAAATAGKSMHIEIDGANITGTIAIPNTGDWQVWQTVTVPNITLTAGTKIMKIVMDTDGFNLNYVNVTASITTPVNVAPTVSLTAPANNASYTAPASVNLTANAADSDGTVSKVEFFNGSTLLATDASAPYTYSWTNVAAGNYTLTAKATDNSGAVTISSTVAITVTTVIPVNVAPTVSLTAPANNVSYTAPASVNLTANAADSDGTVSKVEFFNGSTLLATDASAPYTYSWTNVAAGNYTLTAKATDNSGAVTTSSTVAITVTTVVPVNVAPTVSLTAPANNASYIAPASVNLTANATDSDGTIAKVEFFNGSTLLTGSTNTTAPYAFTWTGVAAGTYTITAKATDNAGAVTTSSAVTITVTTVTPPVNIAPTVSLTAPANNASYTAPASINLTANAADSDGTIAKVEFFNGSTLLTGSTNTTAPYAFTWTGVAAGTYTITAKATDNAGAVTTSSAVTITVTTVTPPVNVAPTVSLTAPANNATYTAPASVNLTANAADSDGTIAKVEFFNGSTLLTGSTNTTAPYAFTWTGVAAGTYTITAKATDNAGAVTTSSAVTITVNPEPVVNPGNCSTEAVPVASQWVVRNSWADQNNGSKVVSTTDALNIKHRPWGNPELWAIQTGKAIAVVSGQTYTVTFDVRNDGITPVAGIDVGFATSEAWNGAVLAQPAVSVSGISSAYTTKTVTITATTTGTVYLALDLKLNGQPNNEVNVFVKNISVCSAASASPAAATFAAPNEVNGVIMGANPFTDQTTVTIPYATNVALTISISDMNGIIVWQSSTLQTNQTVYIGSGLPIGTYVVNASYAGTNKVVRLIKY